MSLSERIEYSGFKAQKQKKKSAGLSSLPPDAWKSLIDRRREQYAIKGIQAAALPIGDRIFTQYALATTGRGPWNILVDPNCVIPATDLVDDEPFDELAALLGSSQTYDMFPRVGTTKDCHDEQTHFFSANWHTLQRMFYPRETARVGHVQSFTEVHLPGGCADFVGIGADNRLIVIEFGRGILEDDYYVVGGGKSSQVTGFASDLQDTFSLESRTITPYVGYYSRNEQGNYLTIHPPRKRQESMQQYMPERVIYETAA